MAWELTGNAGTTAANFLGTDDGQPLVIKTNNAEAAHGRPKFPAFQPYFVTWPWSAVKPTPRS